MSFLSILLIAIGLAMDSFAVCITQGMCRKRFTPIRAIKIALVFGFFQGFMPLIGFLLGVSFKDWIQNFDHWFALIILGFIGGKMIFESLHKEKETTSDNCNNACECTDDTINWKNVIIMSIATSIDALATGLLFVTYDNLIYTASFVIAAVCFLFSVLGKYIGAKFVNRLHFNAELIGGIILVSIGIKIFLEHVL